MLKIEKIGQDCYRAFERGMAVGECRYAERGDTTAIIAITLKDKQDGALLDGLLRAALFFGREEGRTSGLIERSAAAGYQESLALLSLPVGEAFLIEALKKHCG